MEVVRIFSRLLRWKCTSFNFAVVDRNNKKTSAEKGKLLKDLCGLYINPTQQFASIIKWMELNNNNEASLNLNESPICSMWLAFVSVVSFSPLSRCHTNPMQKVSDQPVSKICLPYWLVYFEACSIFVFSVYFCVCVCVCVWALVCYSSISHYVQIVYITFLHSIR